MHVERLKKVRQLIIDNQDRFNYKAFFNRTDKEQPAIINKELTCGTTACIAGWTYLLALQEEYIRPSAGTRVTEIPKVAEDYLGLTSEQSLCLFYCHAYYDKIPAKPYLTATINDALERLDYLIAEGEASTIHDNS